MPLDEQAGTGPALDAAQEVAVVSPSSPGGGVGGGGGVGVQSPLRRERDGHRRATATAAAAGLPPPHFEAWVLWEDDGSDPAISSPAGSSHGQPRRAVAHKLSGSFEEDSRRLLPVTATATLSPNTVAAETGPHLLA